MKYHAQLKPPSRVDRLISLGKRQGYLLQAQLDRVVSSERLDPETVADLVAMLGQLGIPIHENAQTRAQAATSAAVTARPSQATLQTPPNPHAYALAYCGEADRACEWLDKAVEQRDPLVRLISIDPLLKTLHSDPRWLPFLRKLGRAPEQLAAIQFDVKAPN